MKIQGNNPVDGKELLGKVQESAKNQQQPAVKKGDQQPEKTTGDRISLSNGAREIAELKKMIDQLPEIREDKVAAIKKAIESGTYNVDSMKVAEKILEEI
jgi:negative regulator of flagellin synthesis FlgM